MLSRVLCSVRYVRSSSNPLPPQELARPHQVVTDPPPPAKIAFIASVRGLPAA